MVLNKLGDAYQAYSNTYKTHTMATHHGGSGQLLDRDANMTRKDIDVDIPQDFHHEDKDDFENIEHENPTSLAAITRDLDDLHYQVQAGEGHPAEALHHIECNF